jgi:hypothetical protein
MAALDTKALAHKANVTDRLRDALRGLVDWCEEGSPDGGSYALLEAKKALANIKSAQDSGKAAMNKDPESWARVHPEILEPQHVANVLMMAIQDIAALALEIRSLKRELAERLTQE